VSGLVVVFLAWIAKTLFLARRLFLIQPRLFDYSDLVSASTSKTLELTVFNGGARSEEDINVQLSPAFVYTILASNKAGLLVDAEGILKIDRLAPKQDSTVILTAEGTGEFRKEHVIGITSKDTSGKIKEKLQDAQFSPGQNLAALFLVFVLLPACGYFIGHFVIEDAWREFRPKTSQASSGKVLQFDVSKPTVQNISADEKLISQYQAQFSVEKVSRNDDLISVDVKLKNSSKRRLNLTLSTTSPVSEKRPAGVDYIVSDILLFPDSEKTITLVEYLPPDTKPSLVGLEVIVDDAGSRVYFDQDILIKNP